MTSVTHNAEQKTTAPQTTTRLQSKHLKKIAAKCLAIMRLPYVFRVSSAKMFIADWHGLSFPGDKQFGNAMLKSVLISSFATASIAALLSIVALVFVVLQSGYAQPSALCIIAVYLAYWPVLLLGWSAHDMFTSFSVIPINIFLWGIVGALLMLIRRTLGSG
jgi:hypothetical protein